MSTTTAPELTLPLLGGRYHFLLRRLHSLTGIGLAGYLFMHLLVNATIAQGGGVYQTRVDEIHKLPFLPVIEWTFVYLPILYHAIYGIWIILTGQPNVSTYPYGRSVLYLLQRVSAVVIILFVLFHVSALRYGLFGLKLSFEPPRASESIGRHMDASRLVAYAVYPIGVAASCFHLANGLWAAGITWGLTVSAAAQRRFGTVCIVLFVLSLLAGATALTAAIQLS